MSKSPFSVDKPEDSVGFLLWQTTITWQRRIKASLARHSVSHTQFVILANLLWFDEKKIDSTQARLVEQSKIDKMTISTSLKSMVSSGLVERTENKNDTRIKSVLLTKKGRKLALNLVPKVEKIDREYFGSLQENEQKQLATLLLKVITGATID